MTGYKTILKYSALFVLLLITNLVISFYLTLQIKNINSSIDKIKDISTSLVNIESSLFRGVDIGIRGYALSNEEHLLGPYYLALEEKEPLFESLFRNADELDLSIVEIEQLDSIVSFYFEWMNEIKNQIQDNRIAEARAMIGEDKGYNIWLNYNQLAQQIEDQILSMKEANESRINLIDKLNFTLNILMLLIIAPLLYMMSVKTKSLEKEKEKQLIAIREGKDKIASTLEQRNQLFQELHHRIKNNLQLISSLLFIKSTVEKDKELKSFIEETSAKIQSIAQIHDQLLVMEEVNQLNVRGYIEELVGNLINTYQTDSEKYPVQMDIDDLIMDTDIVLVIGLFVNEVVSNTIKHAYPDKKGGPIHISIKSHDESIELAVADEGVGIPEHFINGKSGSYGIQLINIFSNQLKGDLTITNKNGTSILIKFPFHQ